MNDSEWREALEAEFGGIPASAVPPDVPEDQRAEWELYLKLGPYYRERERREIAAAEGSGAGNEALRRVEAEHFEAAGISSDVSERMARIRRDDEE